MKPTITEIVGNEASQFDALSRAVMQDLRCAMPGVIRAYDSDTQTASIWPGIRDSRNGNGFEDLPLLLDVPVLFPGTQNIRLMYPVSPGDECLVIFADQCIDVWWQQGGIKNPSSPRRHDLSDGFCIVAPSSRRTAVPQDGNPFSLRLKVNDEWITPFAIDQEGHVLINGHIV